MAATNNYRLLVETRINKAASDAGITADIVALGKNKQLLIGVKFTTADSDKLKQELDRIKNSATGLGSMKIFADDQNNIKKVIVSYTDGLGKAVRETITLNDKIKATHTYTQNLAKEQTDYNRRIAQSQALIAKNKDEMARSMNMATDFLAKAKNMNQTPSVRSASNIAKQIQDAYNAGNLDKVRTLTEEFKRQKAAIDTNGTAFQKFTGGMKNALVTTAQFALSIQSLYMALNALKGGIQYISDLDKEMTSIQMVTGFSDEQTGKLALSYNELAKEMGGTTIEVAKSSVEWFRQGKTIEETNELIRSSMMMSKLANLDSAQSTEYLTSIINGFKLEASETEDVISKLVALDNAFATSTGEIASAMQRSSVSAQQAGVDMEHLASMITVVSDVTRRAPETIGEAFKTLFARYQDILRGQVDEEGIGINNVAKSLERVGINIRDAAGGFRNFNLILDELYAKWDSINEIEQANILKAMAGTRQREYLLVLLQNEDKYRQAIVETQNAEGLAQERYEIYLNSVQAAQDRMKASAEGMWQATINSDAIKFFYNASAAILQLITNMGGLGNILGIATIAFIVYQRAAIGAFIATQWAGIGSVISSFLSLAAGVTSVTEAMTLLTAATGLSPIGWIAIAIGAAVAITDAFTTSLGEAYATAEKLRGEVKQISDNLQRLGSEKNRVTELYTELQGATEQSERWYEIQNELKDLLPALNGHYDTQGRFIMNQKLALEDLIALKEKEIEIEQRQMALSAKKSIEAEIELYEKLASQRDRTVEALNNESANSQRYASWMKDNPEIRENLEQINIDIEKSKLNLVQFFSTLSAEQQKAYLEATKGTEIYQLLASSISDALDMPTPTVDEGIYEPPPEAAEKDESLEELHDLVIQMIKDRKEAEIDALRDELDAFKDKIEEQKRLLKDAYDDQIDAIDDKIRAIQREGEEQQQTAELEEKRIRQELDGYKQVIDSQLRLLKLQKEAREFANEQDDKKDELAQLEGEIAELQFDTSDEGVARRLELENQATELRKEMETSYADEQYRLQVEGLENEKTIAEESSNLLIQELEREREVNDQKRDLRIQDLEDQKRAAEEAYENKVSKLEDELRAQEKNLKAQIDAIQDYLKQEGTIRRDAMNMLLDENSNVYQELIEWNNVYGTGVKDDIVAAWEAAQAALEAYKQSLAGVSDVAPPSGSGSSWYGDDPLFNAPAQTGQVGNHPTGGGSSGGHTTSHHSGVDSGFIGGRPLLQSNEEFSKLLAGELVVNSAQMDRFMTRVLPELLKGTPTGGNGGNIEVNMPIQCAGNLDKGVIPDLERIADQVIEKINRTMQSRGVTRRADHFSVG